MQPDWSDVPAQAKGELKQLTDKIDHILTIAKGLGKSALHGGAPVTLNDSGDLSDKQIEELKFAQSLPPEAIQQLEQYRNDIDPSSVREPQSEIPPNTLEVIKMNLMANGGRKILTHRPLDFINLLNLLGKILWRNIQSLD